MEENTHRIDSIVDDFYNSRGMTGTMDMVRKVIVKYAIKNPSSELAKNNIWMSEDIALITAEHKSQNRKK